MKRKNLEQAVIMSLLLSSSVWGVAYAQDDNPADGIAIMGGRN